MRYSRQSRERKYVKGYGFLLFTRKLGGNSKTWWQQTQQQRQELMPQKLLLNDL